jgi:hypothetical protein
MTQGREQNVNAHRRDPESLESTLLWCRLYRAERAYDRALTTLWIGNAGGALTTLAYATANRHDGTFTRSLLVPLVLFIVGLVITGAGSLIEFESERRAITRSQRAAPILDAPLSGGEWPVSWRTAMAFASGTCFVVAFIFGFVMLSRN